jgi:hypothetical protein
VRGLKHQRVKIYWRNNDSRRRGGEFDGNADLHGKNSTLEFNFKDNINKTKNTMVHGKKSRRQSQNLYWEAKT